MSGVPGGPGVSGVLGMSGVSEVPASGQLWAGPEPLEHRGHFSPNTEDRGAQGAPGGTYAKSKLAFQASGVEGGVQGRGDLPGSYGTGRGGRWSAEVARAGSTSHPAASSLQPLPGPDT